jgi:hypothetical protein
MAVLRMTMRRWMVAVAIVGIACGVGIEVRREIIETERLRRLAMEAEIEQLLRSPFASWGPTRYAPPYVRPAAFTRPIGVPNPRLALYHRKMTEKRQWALVHPWALLEPDAPPPPE